MLTLPLLALGYGFAFLLIASGVSKLLDGSSATSALRVLVPRVPAWVATIVGVGELALGAAFIVWPSPPTALGIGLAYLLLAGFAATIRGRAESCGCFGASSAPVTGGHVVACMAASLTYLAVFLSPTFGLPAVGWVVVVVLGSAVALLAFGALGPLPRLRASLGEIAP